MKISGLITVWRGRTPIGTRIYNVYIKNGIYFAKTFAGLAYFDKDEDLLVLL